MKKILRIDLDGFFIEDVLIQDNGEIPTDCIEIECPEGFYKPKWNGEEWVEGLTQEQIDEIRDTPQPKTHIEILTERNTDLENLVAQTNADFSAFMDFFFESNPNLA